MSSEPLLKRPSSSLSELPNESASKRLKRPYHHHHRLQCPVIPIQPEPAITDDICVDHLMNRAIGQSLREAGFDLADPVALDSFRNATEECTFHLLQALLFETRKQKKRAMLTGSAFQTFSNSLLISASPCSLVAAYNLSRMISNMP